MPVWVQRIATLGQASLVIAGMAAVVILALNHIIDGAAALTGLAIITGAGTAIQGAIHVVAKKVEQNGAPTSVDH